jgi:hypothetical protein
MARADGVEGVRWRWLFGFARAKTGTGSGRELGGSSIRSRAGVRGRAGRSAGRQGGCCVTRHLSAGRLPLSQTRKWQRK